MTAFFIAIHALCAIFLITVILMQSGRGGGLTEGFASAESLFGAKTNEVMIRATIILAGVFLVTSLSLAYLSAKKDVSLITDDLMEDPAETSAPLSPASTEPVAVPEASATQPPMSEAATPEVPEATVPLPTNAVAAP